MKTRKAFDSGDRNSGNRNSGDRNSGNRNSGDRNSGDMNSGGWNSGYRNSGDMNSGGWNSGYRNSGDRNSGNRNSGYRNSGGWNSCNNESGYFNSKNPDKIRVFNNYCDIELWHNCKKPSFIYNLILNKWIFYSEMSEDEKIKCPTAYVCDGYLRSFSYKEAWLNAYNEASEDDIELLKKLPNFNAKIFEDITGIKIS